MKPGMVTDRLDLRKFIPGLVFSLIVWSLLIGLVWQVTSCATLGTPTVSEECKGSIYAKNPQAIDLALTAAVTGAHVMAYYKPNEYALAHQAAQMAVKLLEGGPVTLEGLVKVPGIDLVFSAITSFFPPNRYISLCDKQVLIKYLSMV